MFKRVLGILTVGVIGAALCNAQEGSTVKSAATRAESEDIQEANKAVLLKLAVVTSPKGQSLCSENPLACIGPDRAELALSLIAARNTDASNVALASLVRFRLDGELAETYSCRLLDKGKPFVKQLVALSADSLRAECHREFEKLANPLDSDLGGVREEYVCRSVADIKREIELTLKAIRSNRHCE